MAFRARKKKAACRFLHNQKAACRFGTSSPIECQFRWSRVILIAVIKATLYGILYFGLSSRQPARNEYSIPISKSILVGAHHVCFILEQCNTGRLDVSFQNHLDSCELVVWWWKNSRCCLWFEPDSRNFGTFEWHNLPGEYSMVRYESLAYPLSNAPALNKIRPELSKKWPGTLKVFFTFYCWIVSLVLQTAVITYFSVTMQ
jgi:hypothetical protein